ncbi:glycosyltransferase family 4 protein [Streptosporangium soli]|nr:glycosyltransferase family 4 protein [Streptosporangium sp. KLBMP 9127]
MRVLFITSSFHPVIGGAETYAWDVADGLASRGHDVLIVTDVPRGHQPGDACPGDPPGVEVRRLHHYQEILADPSKIYWEQMAYGLMPELLDCVTRFRPDLVFTNSMDASILGKTVALERNIPWVAAFHEHSPQDEPLGAGRLRLIYDVLRPSLVLAGSRFYSERAAHWGGGVPVKLVYHGVDTGRFHPGVDGGPMRRRYGYTPQDTVIVCAGRLKPRKGILETIRAFADVHDARPQARLLIVGSVSSASLDYAARLYEEIARARLGEVVTIDETVTFDQMPEVLAAADIVAQPSHEEGLGMSVLEAMSTGRAVVTTDIVGIREILTAPGIARVVPPGAPGPLGGALLDLVADGDLRARLGDAARRHVRNLFSRHRMLERTEAALLALAAGGTVNPPKPQEAGHV